jgi:hypothetical protein
MSTAEVEKMLAASGIRLQGNEEIEAVLPIARGNTVNRLVLTRSRVIHLERTHRNTQGRWAALAEVHSAAIARDERNLELLVITMLSVVMGPIIGVYLAYIGELLYAMAAIGAGLAFFGILLWAWTASGGYSVVEVDLARHEVKGGVATHSEQRATEFINLLFDYKQQPISERPRIHWAEKRPKRVARRMIRLN